VNQPRYYFFEKSPGGGPALTNVYAAIAPIDGQVLALDFAANLIVTINVYFTVPNGETNVQEPAFNFQLTGLASYRTEGYCYIKPQSGTYGNRPHYSLYTGRGCIIPLCLSKNSIAGYLCYVNARVMQADLL
jgi:hypothetical protein